MHPLSPLYTSEIAERILQQLARGLSMEDICSEPGMPSRETVRMWVVNDIEGFAARYREALKAGAPLTNFHPTLFTDEVAETIIAELASGRTIQDLSKDPGMPSAMTIHRWVATNYKNFRARFKEAQEIGRLLGGGPVPYSTEVADRIIFELLGGRLLVDVCELPGMPCVNTVMTWVKRNHDGFGARYREARELGGHIMGDELVKIGDDVAREGERRSKSSGGRPDISREEVDLARVRTDSRRWLLAKLLPRFCGNRIPLEATQDAGDSWDELLKRIDGKSRGLPNGDEPTDG
jgi:hypothetical protein